MVIQWIGLRENLNRKPWFLPLKSIKYGGFRLNFSPKPIHWVMVNFRRGEPFFDFPKTKPDRDDRPMIPETP